jgi:hypothetical protein
MGAVLPTTEEMKQANSVMGRRLLIPETEKFRWAVRSCAGSNRECPIVGNTLTVNPTRLFAFLSTGPFGFLLMPALWARVGLIRDIYPTASKWRLVGFLVALELVGHTYSGYPIDFCGSCQAVARVWPGTFSERKRFRASNRRPTKRPWMADILADGSTGWVEATLTRRKGQRNTRSSDWDKALFGV